MHYQILNFVNFGLFVLSLCYCSALAVERNAWVPSNESVKSAFIRHPNGFWLEKSMAGHEFRFEEEATTDEFVLLNDLGRKMQIRLRSEYAELRNGDQPFARWKTGKWEDKSSLPAEFIIKLPDYKLRLIYFVASDREPTANYQKKITTLMTFVESLYKYELHRRDYKHAGLNFEIDENQLFKVHLVRATKLASRYNNAPEYNAYKQWSNILQDMPAEVASPYKNLMVVFAETYDEGPAKWEWPGGIALGTRFSTDGGCGIFSSWILRDEFCSTTVAQQIKLFNDSTPIPERIALGHGRINSPRFEFIEDGFGAVAHELGHALGLPHDRRVDNLDIMANGFRALRVNLDQKLPPDQRARFSDDNALLLAGSRFINPDLDHTDSKSPDGTLKIMRSTSPEKSLVKLTATDDKELFAAVFFDGVRGSVVGSQKLIGKSQNVELVLPLSPDLTNGQLRLSVQIIDRGGNIYNVVGLFSGEVIEPSGETNAP